MTTTSCEDMLTPDMDLYTENFSGRDTINFYYGILSNVQDMVENNILLGDLRSDMVDTTSYVSDTVARISNFDKVEDGDNGLLNRSAYYKVINQCNFYIAKADTMAKKTTITICAASTLRCRWYVLGPTCSSCRTTAKCLSSRSRLTMPTQVGKES